MTQTPEKQTPGAASRWRRRLSAVWQRVSLGFAVLGVVNVADHLEWVQHLTESLQWVAVWWRFLVDLAFDWLPIELTVLQRDLLVIVALVVSAANLQAHRQFGRSLFSLTTSFVMSGGDEDPYGARRLPASVRWFGRMLAAGALLAIAAVALPIALLIALTLGAYAWVMPDPRRDPFPRWVDRYRITRTAAAVVGVTAFFAAVLGSFFLHFWTFAATYPRTIGTGLAAVVLILGANAVMVEFGDPAEWLPKALPSPPDRPNFPTPFG